jgi:hypothetical protein
MASDEATFFYTLATGAYFAGTVALLNSLRLCGNEGAVVVADAGLSPEQRSRLENHAEIAPLPAEIAAVTYLAKPYAARAQERGVAVLIDSDMLVTRSLEPYVALARDGEICVFADHAEARERRFDEWVEVLGLRAPLRPHVYVNSGFVCVSVDRFPGLLERWFELCLRAPADQAMTTPSAPFFGADQDVLNALLASEVPAGAVRVLPESEEVYWDELRSVQVVDETTLECRFRGTRPAILHYSFAPKPWGPRGWVRVKDDAFVRLLPRVLFRSDVALPLAPVELPPWLRPGRRARLLVRTLDAVHVVAKRVYQLAPPALRRRLLAVRARLHAG